MRKLFAAAFVVLFLVGCGPVAEQPERTEEVEISDERLAGLLVNVKENMDVIQETTVDLLRKLTNYVSAYDIGVTADTNPPFDTTALTDATTQCFSSVHLLGILEYLELDQSTPIEVLTVSATTDVHSGILYGSAKSFLAQVCRELDAAQRSIDSGNESSGLGQAFVVGMYRDARDHLGDGNISLIGAIKTLPAGEDDDPLLRVATPESTATRPVLIPPVSPMVPLTPTLDERRREALPAMGRQIDSTMQSIALAIERGSDDRLIIPVLDHASVFFVGMSEQLWELELGDVATQVHAAGLAYGEAAAALERGDRQGMQTFLDASSDFMLQAARAINDHR